MMLIRTAFSARKIALGDLHSKSRRRGVGAWAGPSPLRNQPEGRLNLMADPVSLRPVQESELVELVRLLWDPSAPGEFQWFGFRMPTVREVERRWHDDGLIGGASSFLAVIIQDDTCAGWVTWRPVGIFGNYEIGIALFPECRGRGIGTEAQRQLVKYLFGTTTAHRLQAGTEVDNLAEQRSLEKVGFRKEGVMRGAHFRAGQWRDSLMYALIREDFPAPYECNSRQENEA